MKSRGSKLYELFVLGKLLDRPAHGYFLSRVMGYAMGPFEKVPWSTLYPLIRRLQEDKLIVERKTASQGKRPRRVYSITAAGKCRFHALMTRLGEYGPDFDEWFRIRLANFRHIARDERVALLADYKHYMELVLADTRGKIKSVQEAAQMTAAERGDVLRALTRQRRNAVRELAWIASCVP